MHEALLALLLGLTPYHGDTETPAQREARLSVVAHAIADVTTRPETAVLLVTLGEQETHYAQHIHEGRCRPHECDHGLSVSPWQVRLGRWLPRPAWEAMRDASRHGTTMAARQAMKALRMGWRLCGGPEGAFSVAARGGCGWPGAPRRAHRYRTLLARYYVLRAARARTAE